MAGDRSRTRGSDGLPDSSEAGGRDAGRQRRDIVSGEPRDEEALVRFVAPANVLDFTAACDADPDFLLTPALIEAWEADRWGNLTYRSSARNFNPVMATAAKLTIVQSQHIVELGALDPEKVATPGIYVNRVLHVPYGEPTVT